MRAVYRPGYVVERSVLPESSPLAAQPGPPLRVPGIDEDEATMAVAAARALLVAQHVAPESIGQVLTAGNTEADWGSTAADALGIPRDRVRSISVVEAIGIVRGTGTDGGMTRLVLRTHLGRPGAPQLEQEGADSHAWAQLVGLPSPAGSDLESQAAAIPVDRDLYAKLARWEQEAPESVARGAYVPTATWDASRPARYHLVSGVCEEGHASFPPGAACPRCGRPLSAQPLPARGTLATYTVIAPGGGPSEFDPLQAVQGEYAVGIAEFGAVRVPGMICDTPLASLTVGLPVEPVFRRLYAQHGAWRYGVKFRGIGAASGKA